MTNRHALLNAVLRPDETVSWSETVSEETLARADARAPIRSGLLAFVAMIFGAWFSVWGLNEGWRRLTEEDYLVLSFSAPIVIVISLAFFWYAFMTLRQLFRPPLITRVPVIYAVTDQRLLALLASGELSDEMLRDDIEGIVDLDSDDEVLVLRKGDEAQEKGFYIMLIKDAEGALDAIRALQPS